jgi:hypothetical protein
MSRVAGSRLLPRISALSFCTASPATAAASSSSSTAAVAAAAATAGDPSSQPPQTARKPWGALKFAAFAAVSAAVGGTGYVSYGTALNPCPARGHAVPKLSFAVSLPLEIQEKFGTLALPSAAYVVQTNTLVTIK